MSAPGVESTYETYVPDSASHARHATAPRWRRILEGPAGYPVGLAIVLLGVLVRWLLDGALGAHAPFMFTIAALVPLAFVLRPGAYFLAAVIGVLVSDLLFVEPRGLLSAGPDHAIAAGAYLLTAGALGLVAWLERRSRERAWQARDAAQTAEEVTRASEQRFRLLVDGVRDYAIFMLDVRGNVASWNAGAERIQGYTADEIIGQHFSCFYPSETVASGHTEHELEVAGREGRYEEQGWRVRKDGSRFMANVLITPLHDSRGALCGFATITRDVTQWNQAQENIRASETRLRLALEGGEMGTWTWHIATDECLLDEKELALVGQSLKDADGTARPFFDALHPADAPRVHNAVDHAIKNRATYKAEFRVILPSGETRWLSGMGRASYDAQGDPVQVSGVNFDITDRKETEQALRESEERLRLALSATALGTWWHELHPDRLYLDERARSHFALEAESSLAQLEPRIHPGDRERFGRAIRAAYDPARDGSYAQEYRIVDEDGSVRWLRVEARVHFDGQGAWRRAMRVIGTSQDISERKRMETALRDSHEQLEQRIAERTAQLARQSNELRQANEALVRSNLDLQQFAYVASHDLQAPLRSISGFVQALQAEYEGRLDAQADQWIRLTVRATHKMQTLMNELLSYARVNSQARPFVRVSLGEIFEEVVSLIEASIHESGALVTRDELPQVMGDRSQLVQLMQNLIGNAVKFHGDKPSRVHVGAQHSGKEWTISVRDNGIGIDPKYHAHIFELFKRLHNQKEYPGTGIGLAVCARVAHRHGGRIWAQSQLGEGSVFSFTVPEGEA